MLSHVYGGAARPGYQWVNTKHGKYEKQILMQSIQFQCICREIDFLVLFLIFPWRYFPPYLADNGAASASEGEGERWAEFSLSLLLFFSLFFFRRGGREVSKIFSFSFTFLFYFLFLERERERWAQFSLSIYRLLFFFCSSQPSMVHWLSSSIFRCRLFVRSFVRPAMVTFVQISLLVAPHPQTHTFSESLW